jgi:deoxyadenosine/deoxycytidine kinase
MFSLLYNFIAFVKELFVPKKWYIIEGNIGCGKTTLIRNLKQSGDYEVIEEPVDEWKQIKDENGENILGLFYKDGHRYAYLFQTIVFKSRMRSLEIEQRKPIRFSERSIWTDKNIFSKNCHEMGLINTVEKSTYDFWFNWLESKITRLPDGIIYLRAAPEICHQRMKKRDRVEETSVSLDYLTKIHEKHEEWLIGSPTYKNVPIYVIDNTVKPEEGLQKVITAIESDKKSWYDYFKTFVIYHILALIGVKCEKYQSDYQRMDWFTKFIMFNIVCVDAPLFIYSFLF